MPPPDEASEPAEEQRRDPAERRAYKRVPGAITGKLFVPASGMEADCAITNVSPAGAEIACDIEGLLEKPIVLYATGLGRFEGHAIWHRDGRYGIEFHVGDFKRARLADQLAHRDEAGAPELRAHVRKESHRHAQFTREDGTIVPCVVLDFSTSGVMVEPKIRPQVGEFVLIAGLAGRVVRVDATGVAIEFVERKQDDTHVRRSLESLDQWRNV